MSSLMHHVVGLTRATGMLNAMRILFARSVRSGKGRWIRSAQSACGRVLLRPTESDLFVASQVFGWKEYDIGALRCRTLNTLARSWREAGYCPVIVDGGANVGYSSLFFANTYPDATVFALEPNPLTFEVLKRNVRIATGSCLSTPRCGPMMRASQSKPARVDHGAIA